ncbi:MAG TPA: hypothetical protein VK927_01340 [Adhaeribacter sp.]|nr:hypothetical protein [Adhaeribacter sp.]
MKKLTAISSLLVLGTVGLLAWLKTDEINLNFSDEDYHLYL